MASVRPQQEAALLLYMVGIVWANLFISFEVVGTMYNIMSAAEIVPNKLTTSEKDFTAKYF